MLADYWRLYISMRTSDGWTAPAVVPYSEGRASMHASGGLWLAWRHYGRPSTSVMINLPEDTLIENVYAARYDPGVEPGDGPLRDRRPRADENRPAPHPNESEDVQRIRGYRVRADGAELRILRGDTHRHTELSMDLRGAPDGSIRDLNRYIFDAASMDWGFISPTTSTAPTATIGAG